MQEKWRLEYRRDVILALDAERLRLLEEQQRHDDSVKALRETVPDKIVVKGKYVNLTPFEQYVQYVKENTTALQCHHRKFHWEKCVGCRRVDPTQLYHLQKYYRRRIGQILAEAK